MGTLCVEFFIDRNDNLYVNEIAPRVHNSGHLTINAYNVSQFENHVRAVCGLEKIRTKKIYNAKMINLIGDDILIYRDKKFSENEFFFDYLKKDVKNKRKMGHVTIIENRPSQSTIKPKSVKKTSNNRCGSDLGRLICGF